MILVFGTVCIDRLFRVARVPQPGGYTEITDEVAALGGEAANTAAVLTAWGVPTVVAGNKLGQGAAAQELRVLLREKGLDLRYFPMDEVGDAPVCHVYVDESGEKTMLGKGFAHMESAIPLDQLPFSAGGWFTTDQNMGDVSREAAQLAKSRGMKLYLMDYFFPEDAVVEGSFWQTSTDYRGMRGDVAANLAWVTEFVGQTGAFTILSDGAHGCVAGGPDQPARAYPGFPTPVMIDATGAGDMLRAGVLMGLDRGWSIGESLKFAAAAASLKCGALGATTRVPTEAEVRAHMAGHPDVAAQFD